MYSCIVEGQVLDFKYKKLTEHVQAFYIGHIYVGQVFKMRYGWTAVSATSNPYGPTVGFKSIYYASDYLLKVSGYSK